MIKRISMIALSVLILGLMSWLPAVQGGLDDTPLGGGAVNIPTIDGTVGVDEWTDVNAATETVTADDGSLQDVTVGIKNDGTYLYMLVQISNADYSDPNEPYWDFIRILFDDNNNGVGDQGENMWAIRYDGGVVADGFTKIQGGYQLGQDIHYGGTNDIIGAITHSNPGPNTYGTYTVEFRGLLDSGDDKDFSFLPGDEIGFKVHMADGDPSPTVPLVGPVGSFIAPSNGFAKITLEAPRRDCSMTGISYPTLLTAGADLVVDIEIKNEGDITDTFYGTLSIDSDTVDTFTVTDLLPGDSVSLQSTISTELILTGVHEIVCDWAPVPFEEDIEDNTHTGYVHIMDAIIDDDGGEWGLGPDEGMAIADGATATGDVTVDGGVLWLTEGSTLDGNIYGTEGGDIYIQDGSTVTGDIIHTGGILEISDSTLLGNGIRINTLHTNIKDGSVIKGDFTFQDPHAVTLEDATFESGLVIDITSAGFELDKSDIRLEGTNIIAGINIDHTSAGLYDDNGYEFNFEMDEVSIGESVVLESSIQQDSYPEGLGLKMNLGMKDSTIGDSVTMEAGISQDSYPEGLGVIWKLDMEGSNVGGNVVMDAGISQDSYPEGLQFDWNMNIKGSDLGNDLVIDIPSSGLLEMDETDVGNNLVIDITSAGYQDGEDIIQRMKNSYLGNNLVIDITSAGYQNGDDPLTRIGTCEFQIEGSTINNNLMATCAADSSTGSDQIIITDSLIDGKAQSNNIALDLTDTDIGEKLSVHNSDLVMGGGSVYDQCLLTQSGSVSITGTEMNDDLKVTQADNVDVSTGTVDGDLKLNNVDNAVIEGNTIMEDLKLVNVDNYVMDGNTVYGKVKIK